MIAADNDNGRHVVITTDRETCMRVDALRTHLGVDDDGELLELALEAFANFEREDDGKAEQILTKAMGSAVVERRFPLTPDAAGALDALTEESGNSASHVVRQALRALFRMSGNAGRSATVSAIRP